MTRKDYELIAQVITDELKFQENITEGDGDLPTRWDVLQSITKGMSKALANDNKNFDAGKFFKACGL